MRPRVHSFHRIKLKQPVVNIVMSAVVYTETLHKWLLIDLTYSSDH